MSRGRDAELAPPQTVLAIPPGKLVCVVTGTLREDTPEERVRQRFALGLMEEYRYPKKDIEIEFPVKLGRDTKRADIAIFLPGSAHAQENALLLVEVKRRDIKENDKKDGVGQLKSYMAGCQNSRFGCWTNGDQRICLFKREESGPDPFQEIIDLPEPGQTLNAIGQPDSFTQVPAVELRSIFRRCHDYAYANQGLRPDAAFHEFLKVVFCKVWDERNLDKVRFHVTDKEARTFPGQKQVKARLDELFGDVKDKYGYIFPDPNEKIELDPRVAAYIVSQFQRYSLLNTDADVKGAAYEEIVGANLRGNRGEFFTPRNVCNLAISMVAALLERENRTIQKVRLIDPACGTGGFLVAYIQLLRRRLYDQYVALHGQGPKADQFAEQELPRLCQSNIYGLDFNELLVRSAQMNELLHGDGSGNLAQLNSLMSPAVWEASSPPKAVSLGNFDVVVTNPPFGANTPIKDPEILDQYDTARVWKPSASGWERTAKVQAGVPPEELFVERCIQFLRPGGLAAIIVPDRLLSNPGLSYFRQWLLEVADPIASVSLPRETFQPFTDEQTDILIVRKRDASHPPPVRMFTAIARNVGHDNRGTPIYSLDEDGEAITESVIRQTVRIEGGKRIMGLVETQELVLDDDLPRIKTAFQKWLHEGGGGG